MLRPSMFSLFFPYTTLFRSRLYKQEVNLFKFGRMPLNCVVDAKGHIRYAHYGNSMSNIPANETLLDVIDKLNAASVDWKSTRLNSSHLVISYAVFCLKKKQI